MAGKDIVFLVEDDLKVVDALQKQLGDTYEFWHAKNGQEALEKLENIQRPDIIISDVMMSEMDGFTFFEKLKKDKRFAFIPFIFLTGMSDSINELKGLESGAVDYIIKPFRKEEIRFKVKNIIENKKRLEVSVKTEIMNGLAQLVWDDKKSGVSLLNDNVKSSEINANSEKSDIREGLYKLYKITEKEKVIIDLLLKGKENKEIADILENSVNTIKYHIAHIYNKLNVSNKIEMIKLLGGI